MQISIALYSLFVSPFSRWFFVRRMRTTRFGLLFMRSFWMLSDANSLWWPVFIVFIKPKKLYFGAIKAKQRKEKKIKMNRDDDFQLIIYILFIYVYMYKMRLHIPNIFSKFIWRSIILVGSYFFIYLSTDLFWVCVCARVKDRPKEEVDDSLFCLLLKILLTVLIAVRSIYILDPL